MIRVIEVSAIYNFNKLTLFFDYFFNGKTWAKIEPETPFLFSFNVLINAIFVNISSEKVTAAKMFMITIIVVDLNGSNQRSILGPKRLLYFFE
jgi:hypothetical protein